MKNLVLLTTVTAGLNLALMSSANGATYGGDATGAVVTVTATGTTIRAATGTLSISGGEADSALSVGDIPGSATGGAVALAASALSSVVLGTADAKIDCVDGSSPGENWVSGGGWILGQGGIGRATFGFVAGPGGGGSTRGHLTLKDQNTGATIHGTVINNFTECLSGQSRF